MSSVEIIQFCIFIIFIFNAEQGAFFTFQKEIGRADSLPQPAASTRCVLIVLVYTDATVTCAGSVWRWSPQARFKSLSLPHIPFVVSHLVSHRSTEFSH